MIWGTAFVAQDICADKIEPMTFNASRFFIAFWALLFIVFVFDKIAKSRGNVPQQKLTDKSTLVGGFWCGTVLGIATNLQQAGMSFQTDSGKAGFITALYIVLVPIMGLFLKKKVCFSVWVSVGIAVVAMYLLCVTSSFTVAFGDLLMLLCAVAFAGHIMVCDHFSQFVDGAKLSCVQFFFATLWSLVGAVLTETIDLSMILSCALPILYVGIFSSGVGYTLQILAQKDSNPTVVSILLSLESVFAVIAGAIILQQQMTGREYAGCVLMLVAVVLAQIPMPEKKKSAA